MIASIATADMAATPPGAAACWLVSSGVSGQIARRSTNSAGRPHSQNRIARLTAVLTALAPLTRSDDSTAACMPKGQVSLMRQQAYMTLVNHPAVILCMGTDGLCKSCCETLT